MIRRGADLADLMTAEHWWLGRVFLRRIKRLIGGGEGERERGRHSHERGWTFGIEANAVINLT